MRLFLNLTYCLIVVLLTPLIAWRYFVQGKNRRGWSQKLTGRVPRRNSNAPCFWVHAVSVGEVILLDTLIEEMRERMPDHEIVISTTTESGYDLACQRYSELTVFFCPADFSWAIRRALKRVRPTMLLLSELELWPNLISTAHEQGIPIAVINGRLSRGSFKGYKMIRWISKPMIEKISLCCVQTARYARRFIELGAIPDRVKITGSVKFDSVASHAPGSSIATLRTLAHISNDDIVWLAGSTQENEDRIAIQTFAKLCVCHPKLKLILVPRHPNRCHRLKKYFKEFGLDYQLRSQLSVGKISKAQVLVVDVIGELSAWWGIADFGYVGGSMGSRGGQNMIEPSSYGIPICFGPDTENFQAVVELLLSSDAAKIVRNQEEMLAFVQQNLNDPKPNQAMGQRAAEVVLNQKGATSRTVKALSDLVASTTETGATKSTATASEKLQVQDGSQQSKLSDAA